jgi:hypothetical protein
MRHLIRAFAGLALACALVAPPASAQVVMGFEAHGGRINLSIGAYPDLVPIPGYPVYYAPDLGRNYFFYDGLYWVYHHDRWYSSDWYDGPWDVVDPFDVPLFVLRIPLLRGSAGVLRRVGCGPAAALARVLGTRLGGGAPWLGAFRSRSSAAESAAARLSTRVQGRSLSFRRRARWFAEPALSLRATRAHFPQLLRTAARSARTAVPRPSPRGRSPRRVRAARRALRRSAPAARRRAPGRGAHDAGGHPRSAARGTVAGATGAARVAIDAG